MRKLIAAINMTLDGYCDHTAVNPDEEVHQYYTDLISSAGAILYGRTTFQLMQFWQELVKNPSREKVMDNFATAMNKLPKVVFSRTLKSVDWESARLATQDLKDEIVELKQQSGKDIYVGSPSMIVQSMNLGLVDELQLCVHPVIVGSGLPLFKNLSDRTELNLINTKTFGSGAVLLSYQPKA